MFKVVRSVAYVLGLLGTFVGTVLLTFGVLFACVQLLTRNPGTAGGLAAVFLPLGGVLVTCGVTLARLTHRRSTHIYMR